MGIEEFFVINTNMFKKLDEEFVAMDPKSGLYVYSSGKRDKKEQLQGEGYWVCENGMQLFGRFKDGILVGDGILKKRTGITSFRGFFRDGAPFMDMVDAKVMFSGWRR